MIYGMVPHLAENLRILIVHHYSLRLPLKGKAYPQNALLMDMRLLSMGSQ
jgi:hypothetical protein